MIDSLWPDPYEPIPAPLPAPLPLPVENKENPRGKYAALQEKLIPIVSKSMFQYEGKADINEPNAEYHGGESTHNLLEKAAECTISLRDKKTAERLIIKMQSLSSTLSWQGKKLTILLEDEDKAKVFESICSPDSWVYEDVALFAAKISDKTIAKRIIRGLEEKRGVACAVVVATEIGDEETIERYVRDYQINRKEDLAFYRFPIKLALSQPELAKRKMKHYEDNKYWSDMGEIAAVLGDIPTAQRAISKLKEQRLYGFAGIVAAILGDLGTAELMMWERKKDYEYDFDRRRGYHEMPSAVARYTPEAAYHLMQALEKQGYNIDLIAARILEQTWVAY